MAVSLFLLTANRSFSAGTLVWRTNEDRVTAEIKSVSVPRLLEGVAKLTGWQIYLESNVTFNVSAKFNDLPGGQALRLLLGDLNYALLPQTNGRPHLYVFRSSQKNATLLIHPSDLNRSDSRIPNELILRLRPGANADALAKALGAKIVGRMDGLNAYRLKFDDENAANAARDQLAGNSDVTGIESNYYMEPPPDALKLNSGASVAPIQLKLNPPTGSDHVIVGLVDTAVQPLGNDLDKFMLKPLSVTGAGTPDSAEPMHGTSMFENILRAASAVSGGSSSMQVLPVSVTDADGTMNTFNVAAGIVQAANNGANPINLSLGTTADSSFLHDVITDAAQHGISIFAAAGNDGSTSPYYPAAYPEVVAVTASGSQGKPASYANTGSFVDLIAPGSSAVFYNNNAWLVTGTSTSTALVSGTVGATADSKHAPMSQVVNAILSSPTFKFTPPK